MPSLINYPPLEFLFFLNKTLKLIFVLFVCAYLFRPELIAQSPKIVEAFRIDAPIKIDAKLSEDSWKNADAAKDFITYGPEVGLESKQKTEVKIIYDDVAIYIGARMYDSEPDKILRELADRDDFQNVNADFFMVAFDTYKDGQNGIGFLVTAAGVQSDFIYTGNGIDDTWNGVWMSKVSKDEQGWVAEIRIPYSTLRFSKLEVQEWGLGFERSIRRLRENSTWQSYDPAEQGVVRQFGTLKNLKNIEPPIRLSITPYASVYTDVYTDASDNSNNRKSFSVKGGVDLKYGINESFTLDMTVIPDFGQVQSDDEVLNLSPFEVQYNEQRPFFIEGVQLFNRASLFYSRRIGGVPLDYWDVDYDEDIGDELISNPGEVQMFNATKISGRTKNGLGIGFFNSVTGKTIAKYKNAEGEIIEQQTDALTNYNIFVLDQSLKNSSYVSLINTSVIRNGSFRDANVTGTEFYLSDKKQQYAISGNAAMSQIFDKGEFDKPSLGHKHLVELGKVSGEFKWNVYHEVVSDTYDQNDLGFIGQTNYIANGVNVRFNKFDPFWKFLNTWSGIYLNHNLRYRPTAFQDVNLFANTGGTFKRFFSVNTWINLQPFNGKDFFEPRMDGRHFINPAYFNWGLWMSSDYRKTFAFDGTFNITTAPYYDMFSYAFYFAPRIRLSDKMSITSEHNYEKAPSEVGFATHLEYDIEGQDDDVIFGNRDRTTVTNTINAKYTFTSRMGLNLRLRHYWSKVVYDEFFMLEENGELADDPYTGDHNTSFNALTLNLNFNWQFAPGSELTFVWKNDIYRSDDSEEGDYISIPNESYFNNVSKLFDAPMSNSFSLRALYYLDYQMIKGLKKRPKKIM